MKISAAQVETISAQPEPTVDSKLELLRFASQIHSRINKDIKEDFVLAKLPEKDKEGIIEMTNNAYYVKKIVQIIRDKATKYDWNNQEKTWEKRPLNNQEKEYITKISHTIFDSFMTRIYMTVILNRNVSENHLLKIIAGVQEETETTQIEQEKRVTDKIKEILKPNQKEQET